MLTPPSIESSAFLVEKSTTMLVDQKKLGETYVEKKGEGCGVLIATSLVILEKKCWKLIGRPPNREWGQKRDLSKKGGHAHMAGSTRGDNLEGCALT